jgi:uncharacterized membrane protein YphA (DoxX/SURF4 family)
VSRAPLAALVDAWQRFWFSPGSTQSLGLFRIFYGSVVVLKMIGVWGLWRIGSWSLAFPDHHGDSQLIAFSKRPIFHDPVPGFGWIPALGPAAWHTVEDVALVAAICFTIGLFTRLASLLVFLFFAVPMLYSRLDYLHHLSNFALVMSLVIFLPTGDHYSLDRRLFRRNEPERPRTMMSVRMMQVLLSWIYFSTFLGKGNAGWFTGTMFDVMVREGMAKGPLAEHILALTGTLLLSWYTLAAQAFFGVCVWVPRLRKWAILGVFSLHLGIDAMMNVTTFSYQMWALYTVFIHPWSQQTVVSFDSRAAAQRRLIAAARALNWLDRFRWVDRAGRGGVVLPLDIELADGRRETGIRALRELCGRLPLAFVPSFALEPFMWFSRPAELPAEAQTRGALSSSS